MKNDIDTVEEKDFSELLDEYQKKKKMFHFEGDSGLDSLNELFETFGYGHNYKYGSPLEAFLSDNPGACEVLIKWAANTGNHVEGWKDGLQGALDDLADDEEESVESLDES